MIDKVKRIVSLLGLGGIFILLSSSSIYALEFNESLGKEIVGKCSQIKVYLKEDVRIHDLATRQNRVRAYEFILKRIRDIGEDQEDGLDEASVSSFKDKISLAENQLTQFKNDFEVYDEKFVNLIDRDCSVNPEIFWDMYIDLKITRRALSNSTDFIDQKIMELITDGVKLWIK
jgi:hypothetical protein